MANIGSLTAHLGVDTTGLKSAAQDFQKFERNTTTGLTTITKAAGLLAAAFGGLQIAQSVKDSALLAARYDTLGVAMRTVGAQAGYTSTQMAGFQKGLEKAGISMIESRNNLTRMAQAQIDLANSTKLARIAQDTAVIGGINSSEAFARMVHGMQSGQIEVLRTIGINVNFENSYKKLAGQLGVTTKELNETQKMTARVNSVMEAGSKVAGTYEAAMGTAGKQLLSMERYSENLKVKFGSVFNDALIVGVQGLTAALKDANAQADELSKNRTIEAWGKGLVYTMAAVADAVSFPFKVISQVVESIIANGFMAVKTLELVKNAATGNISEARKNWDEIKALEEQHVGGTSDRWTTSFIDQANKMYEGRKANADKDARLAAENEKRIIASGIATRKLEEEIEANRIATEKAAVAAEKFRDEWAATSKTLNEDMRLLPLEGLEKDLEKIAIQAEKFRDMPFADPELINRWQKMNEEILITAENTKGLNEAFDKQAIAMEELNFASMSSAEQEAESIRKKYEQLNNIARQLAMIGEITEETADKFQETFGEKMADELDNLGSKAVSLADTMKQAVEGWGRSSSDAIANFATSGKLSFKDMARSMINDMLKMILYQQLLGPLFSGLSGVVGSFGTGAAIGSSFAAGVAEFGGGRASGGPVHPGSFYEVNEDGPELLNVGSKQFLMMGQQSGNVTPAGSGMNSGGSVNITNNMSINVGGSDDDPESARKYGKEIGKAIEAKIAQQLQYHLRPFGILNQHGAQ